MKGHITRHEWVSEPCDWLEECAHCKTQRQNQSSFGWVVPGNYVYRKDKNYDWQYEEPKCITRKIKEDEKER